MIMAKKRGKRSTREAKKQQELPGGFWRQVGAVLMIAVAVILVMTWFGGGGSLLNTIHGGMTFLVGHAAYILPILLVYLAVMIFRSEDNLLPTSMWAATALIVIWTAGVMGIPTIGQANPTGGVIGEWLNGLTTQVLNPGVVVFIYIVLIFVTGVFIFQTTPAAVFRAILRMFRGTKGEEDAKNAQLARRAEKGDELENLKVNIGGKADTVQAEDEKKVGKLRFNDSSKVAAPAPAPDRALVSATDPNWKMPSVDMLEQKISPPDAGNHQQNAMIIKSTLKDFGIDVEMDAVNVGPRVTQYTMKPSSGVNLSKILARDKELALNLAVDSVRIEAPIPGTRLVGVEIPNVKAADVRLRAILESDEWKSATDPLTFALGKDISGHAIVANLADMPHLLIAGTTGSGKSVMTNTMIVSLLYRNAPSDLKLIIVDPKQVEMVQYEDIPHLLTPIINDTTQAVSALKWAVDEMERRYKLLAEEHVKTIVDYNKKMAKGKGQVVVADEDGNEQKQDGGRMPYIVILIDEMSDLMMQAGKELEPSIVRIAQKGRAAGLHLILATQKPVVKVVTGLIKSNVPSRIAFAVQNSMDSVVMLGKAGAEKLLGKGDMLFLTTQMSGKPKRIQGAWMSDAEEEKVAAFLKEQSPPNYNNEVISQAVSIRGMGGGGGDVMDMSNRFDPNDPTVRQAVEITLNKGKFSTAMLQTYLSKGHGYVSRLAIWLEEIGVIGPQNGNKPRDVLIRSMDEFDQMTGL